MKTIALCATCGNESDNYAYLGRDEWECESCYDTCKEPVPDGVEIYRTTFTGETRARCNNCDFVSAYWECACELVHDCEGSK